MIFEALLFYLFSAVLLGAALGVVFARNPVHSVMFLVLTFFNSAILWLMAERRDGAVPVRHHDARGQYRGG
jgi:NADH-quinone oxidoreductase subunit J